MSLSFDLISTTSTWGLLLLAAASLMLAVSTAVCLQKVPQFLRLPAKAEASVVGKSPEDAYYSIEPLVDFDVDAEEPIKARPFKPKYHMTMALENTTLSELVAMDKTYHERIQLRRKLLTDEHHQVLGNNARADPAVLELYTWLTQTYLPTRFPTMFTRTPTGLTNKTTHETLPSTPTSAVHALELLGSHIDTDFLILQPSPSTPPSHPKYQLESFITCFPSGFSTRSKLGLQLSEIHSPVPHYAQKLERSMDRYFAGLPVGRIVRRWNWAVSTTGALFATSGNHATPAQAARESTDVDLRRAVLRCERQTLHRLPRTGALVFAFKTFQYPLRDVRAEGVEVAERLCEAIDGLGAGSAPGMTVYKRQVVWGEKVKAFLRGEIAVDG